ncbi:hypothetical protein D3C87_1194540 [compost metagenome]
MLARTVGHIRRLLFQDARRAARNSRIENQNIAFDGLPDLSLQHERRHQDAVIRLEFDKAQPTVRRRVLILLSDRLTTPIYFDFAAQTSQLFSRDMPTQIGRENIDQTDGKGAGRPQPGAARWNIGGACDFNSSWDFEHLKRRTNQAMLDLFDVIDFFGLGIRDSDPAVELLVDAHIDVFVHGGRKHRSAMLSVVAWQVASAADKAHPQRCPANDHGVSMEKMESRSSTPSAVARAAATEGISSCCRCS